MSAELSIRVHMRISPRHHRIYEHLASLPEGAVNEEILYLLNVGLRGLSGGHAPSPAIAAHHPQPAEPAPRRAVAAPAARKASSRAPKPDSAKVQPIAPPRPAPAEHKESRAATPAPDISDDLFEALSSGG